MNNQAAKAIMFMGTGSDVGKSLIVAGLCRALANRGMKVAPFKPQNMSNNAAVTADGGEIGRAQALQAKAARIEATTLLNPVLLKPESEIGAQVILRGKRYATLKAREYFSKRSELLPKVVESFHELQEQFEIVLIEGAGSASEINLRASDIANFGFAQAANVPVVVIGDIARGGVIAALVGTKNVIADEDAQKMVATLINNFHGDPKLFEKGKEEIATRTGVPCLGPVPFFNRLHLLPQEDALGLAARKSTNIDSDHEESKAIKIAVPKLPRIANFDDFDPLFAHPNVDLEFVEPGNVLPTGQDLIILPGSKSTIADLQFLKSQGWDIDIQSHLRQGGKVLGICGGYQMLGQQISDPQGLEGKPQDCSGLGLLDIRTNLEPTKQLRIERGVDCQFGQPLLGYHMHLGETVGDDCARPFARVEGQGEGAISPDGKIMGTYLHGLFSSASFLSAFLQSFGADAVAQDHERIVDQILDDWAAHLEEHLDIDEILRLATKGGGQAN